MLVLPLETEIQINLELKKIGVDRFAVEYMTPKGIFRVFKIKDISTTAANILKQEMLSRGGEVATAKGVIDNSISHTDVLIFGTLKQFEELMEKMKKHQFGLPELSKKIQSMLNNYQQIPQAIQIGSQLFNFDHRTYLMGILNVTPDSFSDGGKFNSTEKAFKRAMIMIEEGADIIDIGGESSRPGAAVISVKEELARVIPVIQAIREKSNIPISIDTQKSQVAEAAINVGADLVNDVSAFSHDVDMAKTIAKYNIPIILMHMQGTPQTMQNNPNYNDLMAEIISHLNGAINRAIAEGIAKEKIIIDPGIGFGKTLENNFEILKKLKSLKSLGQPILIGTSRKSLIGKILNDLPENRFEGTVATVVLSVVAGANIIRAHDIAAMKKVITMTDAIIKKK